MPIASPSIDNAAVADSDPNRLPAADAWRGFQRGPWESRIDVRDFIQRNFQPYQGDQSFLAPATQRTEQLWDRLKGLLDEERKAGGVLDADTKTVGQIASHSPGYIDKELEQIVGVQTDAPLKRAMMPYGGLRVRRTRWRPMDGRWTPIRPRCSPGTARHTTMASLMLTRLRYDVPALPGSSPGSPTDMGAAVSSATIAASHSMALTG